MLAQLSIQRTSSLVGGSGRRGEVSCLLVSTLIFGNEFSDLVLTQTSSGSEIKFPCVSVSGGGDPSFCL